MKIIMLIILILLGLTYPLQSDTLYLNNGDQINGQLLKVTSAGLIFEVRSGIFINEYRTFPGSEVLKVIDDNGKVLFEDDRLKVDYLSDYYNNPQRPSSFPFRLDTLYFSDNSRLPVYVTEISNEFIFYLSSFNQPQKIEKQSLNQISCIKSSSVKKYGQVNWFYPKERIMTYPILGIEISYGLISTHLSTLSNLKIDSTITGVNPTEPQQFRAVRNTYNSFQLGLFIQVNTYLSIHALGYYIEGFNRSTNEDYEPERDESYYLATTEVHLTFPRYFIKPWAGLGYAHQSVTVISHLEGFDAAWRNQSNSFDLSAGFDMNVTQNFVFSLSWRSMYFPNKPIAKNSYHESIDLANQVFSGGLKVIL